MSRLPLVLSIVALATAALPSCRSLPDRLPSQSAAAQDAAFSSARAAWDALPTGRKESPDQQLAYNSAMAGLLKAFHAWQSPASWSGTQSIGSWQVTFDSPSDSLATIAPAVCASVAPIPDPAPPTKGTPPAHTSGLGLPVVMKQPYKASRAAAHKLFPLNGRHLPATMTANFTGPRSLSITFHNTWNQNKTSLRNTSRTLAADYAAAIHHSMDPKFLGAFSLKGLLHPEETLEDAGLYLPFPCHPDKIPVVFVHGLNSDPHIWENAMREIASDPDLRSRYQPWYFLYPTGLPIHGSAAKLRRALTHALEHYDPNGKSPALHQMVLVGHSMGGIISRLQVTNSGDDFYRAYFSSPPEKLLASSSTKRSVQENLFFKPAPHVSRVIFVAVPHRGSRIADMRIVTALTGLIQRAVRVDQFITDIARTAGNVLNPELLAFKDLGGRSVQNLSPRHPVLKAMDQRPVAVPYHSIIGIRKQGKPLPETSDGVVPYSSAHLDGAVSELPVPAWHSCTARPDVTAEIRRILRSHAHLN